MSSQNVEVKLELGHKASLRDKTTSDGYTHDWTLFVRGPDGCNIQHFVEKVVFFLHESFPKPKRVLKEPPYHVSESGYAGFNLAIEVHFRNKEDPKKVRFDYDLYLHLEGPPIQNSRLEKLTFQNPNPDFRKKLLKGGGVAISGGSQSNNCSNPIQTETEQTPKSKSIKGGNEGPKKTPKVKLPHATKQEVPVKVPETSHHPFTHIFGAPLKTKSSPESCQKSKDNTKERSSNSGNSKTTSSFLSTTTTSVQNNNVKSTSKESHKVSSSSKEKVSKAINKEAEKKETKSGSENKSSTLKRSISPLPQNQGHNKGEDLANKKRKRSTSTSSATSSVTEKNCTSRESKSKPKEKEKDHKKEHKVVTTQMQVPPKKDSYKQSKPAQVAPRKEPRELKSPASHSEDQENLAPVGRARLESESSESSLSSQDEKEVKPEEGESQSSVGTASSPSSSLTLSSITPGSTHGPLATMMAQMEQELVSPLSSDQVSPVHSVGSPEEEERIPSAPSSPATPPTPVKVEDKCNKRNKEKKGIDKLSPTTKKAKDDCESSLPGLPMKGDGKQQPIDAAYLRELMQLQKRIMSLSDKQHLQRIVDVIEETGLYQITSSTIDFDLCALDRSTVQKLQNCMAVT